jgi:hypothetical protein
VTPPLREPDARPRLLPNISAASRNAVVYGVAALIAVQVSCGLYLLSPESGGAALGMLVASLCGLPLLAFGLGYATMATWGTPRRPVPGEPARWHAPKWGAVITFGGVWFGWALLLLIASLL